MPSTVFFNLVTLPYSTINAVEVRLFKTSSPNALVVSQSKPAPHPQHTWSFPGLDRTNYIVRIFDMASPIPFQLGDDFTVIPDNNEVRYHDPFWIEFDITPNPDDAVPFASGVNTFIVESWIGWDILFTRKGADYQKEGRDYTWDKTTGVFTLSAFGDLFQPNELWLAEFMPLVQASSSVPTGSYGRMWSSRLKVTANITLTTDDIAKKILIKGASNYLEIILPDVDLVPEDVVTWFESSRISHLCVKIVCAGSNLIDFLGASRNALYIIPNESFEIYKEVDPDTSAVRWRIQNACGQFASVGRFTTDYGGIIYGSVPAAAFALSIRSYARLYWEYVKNLGAGQVCTFADWSVGNNKYKFSLADVETSSGVFHVPDLIDMYEKNSGVGTPAASFQAHQVLQHRHASGWGESQPTSPFGKSLTNIYTGSGDTDNDNYMWWTDDGMWTDMNPAGTIGSTNEVNNYKAVKRILI